MVLPDIANFIVQVGKWSYELAKDFATFISDTFPFTNPSRLLGLSLIMLAGIIGLLFLFGGAGIAGSEFSDAGKGSLTLGANPDDFNEGVGLAPVCRPGNVGDIDCDGIPDEMDRDIDGDGVANDDDDDPYGADDHVAGGDNSEGGEQEGDDDDPPDEGGGYVIPRCGDDICQATDVPVDIYLSKPTTDGDEAKAADNTVFCGIPRSCIRGGGTDEDYSISGCSYGDSGDQQVIVGEANVYENLNEYCSLTGSTFEDWDSSSDRWYWNNDYVLRYVESHDSCESDCEEEEEPPDPPDINHCENMIRDQGEEGVDCGGSCPEPCSCFTHQDCEDDWLDAGDVHGCLSDPDKDFYSECFNSGPGNGYDIVTYYGGTLFHCCGDDTIYANRCVNSLPLPEFSNIDNQWGCFERNWQDCNTDRLYHVESVEEWTDYDGNHDTDWFNMRLSQEGHSFLDQAQCGSSSHVYDTQEPAPVSVDPEQGKNVGDNQVIFNFLG